jgi:hypothetical protein
MEVGIGVERIFFFSFMFLMLCHISACLWVICAKFTDDADTGTWIKSYGIDDHD